MSTIAKVWKVKKPFVGAVTKDHFTFEEETLPGPKDGEFLAEAVFLTVDPYMKAFGGGPSGNVMASVTGAGAPNQVARVKESKNPKFPVGTIVKNTTGWRTHFISDGTNVTPLPDMSGQSPSHALGALGMPGITAYCAFIYDCQPKAGEVLVVNAAAGAVGCLIVQIAKAVGCTVIAYAGTDAKCTWLKELGADHAYNYKKTDLAETLKEAAPDGVDCFVDHVGGTTFAIVLNVMRKNGRVSVVGAISQYNKTPDQYDKIVFNSMVVIHNTVNIRGFMASDYFAKAPEVIAKLIQWNKEGKVKFPEKMVDGFEHMVDAFLSLFSGEENHGKVIIKV